LTDRIRYESKKAFAEAAGSGKTLAPGLKAFAAAMARWTAQREFAKLVAKHENAREDNGQQKDFEP
jgi:hypothetical protein